MNIQRTSTKDVIYGFDLLKFLMALMIVAIHARAFCNPIVEQFTYTWTRVAVPMFFVLSSFLLFKKIRNDKAMGGAIVFKFCKRLSLMYFFWFVLQLPLIVKEGGYLATGFIDCLILILKGLTVGHTFHGSWFLSALLLSICIISLADKVGSKWLVGAITVILFMFNFERQLLPEIFSSLYVWISESFNLQINLTFIYGIIWVGLGYFLSHPKIDNILKLIKPIYSAIGVITLYVLDLFYLVKGDISVSLMVILLYILFYNLPLNPKSIYLRLRNLSILFFLIHFLICGFFHKAFSGVDWLYSGLIFYAIVLVVTYGIASTILWLENKKGFKWLKYSH